MKSILNFVFLAIAITFTNCNSSINEAISSNNIKLEDGIYLIHRKGDNSKEILPLTDNEKIIQFNKEFIEKTDPDPKYLVINTKEFAPLLLKEKPTTEVQTPERKKLMLTLNEEGKERLKEFSAKNLYKSTTIVVNGEALTMHQIKEVLVGGFLQITRCNDNACELLYFALQDNIITKTN